LAKLEFCGVLDKQDAFINGNETRELPGERRFPRARSAADEYIFSLEDVVFQTVRKSSVEGSGTNQVVHLEVPRIEFTAAMAMPTPKSTPARTRFEPPSPKANVSPDTTIATSESPRAMVLVKAC